MFLDTSLIWDWSETCSNISKPAIGNDSWNTVFSASLICASLGICQSTPRGRFNDKTLLLWFSLRHTHTHIHHNYKSKDWNYEKKEIQEGLLSLSAENET